MTAALQTRLPGLGLDLLGCTPAQLAGLRPAWIDGDTRMPPIAPDASVCLGYSVADMPQRRLPR